MSVPLVVFVVVFVVVVFVVDGEVGVIVCCGRMVLMFMVALSLQEGDAAAPAPTVCDSSPRTSGTGEVKRESRRGHMPAMSKNTLLLAVALALAGCPEEPAEGEGEGEIECRRAPTPDLPDNLQDENCDGIDGDAALAVFVAPTGDDSNPGSQELPKKTIFEALAEAERVGRAFVFVSAGSYVEPTLVIDGDVSIVGGYDVTAAWDRSGDKTLVSIENEGQEEGDVVGVRIAAGATG